MRVQIATAFGHRRRSVGASIFKELRHRAVHPQRKEGFIKLKMEVNHGKKFFLLMKDQVPVNVKSENKGGSGSVHEVEVEILVGFYYNRYNAEKDLPTILLSDSSLLEDVTAEISKEIFRKKAGFRIKIFPLSKTNALRACTKIRASGELCDIPE